MTDILEQARICGYIIARYNRRESRLASAWFDECMRSGRPYIRITPRTTWAAIELDMFTTERKLGERTTERLVALLREYWEALPMRQKTCAAWGGGSAWLPSVRIADAPALAEALLSIAEEDELIDEWERVACDAWEG